MNMRVNAGLGMARITERVHQIAMAHQPNAVGAVGQVKVFPNSRNVIPGKVRVGLILPLTAPGNAGAPKWNSFMAVSNTFGGNGQFTMMSAFLIESGTSLIYFTGVRWSRSERPCYDLIAEGYSSVMDLTGEFDYGPQKVGTPDETQATEPGIWTSV